MIFYKNFSELFQSTILKEFFKVGDGTTSVVIVAAELLKSADELVKQQVHPTTVINGYRLACKESVRYMQVGISAIM